MDGRIRIESKCKMKGKEREIGKGGRTREEKGKEVGRKRNTEREKQKEGKGREKLIERDRETESIVEVTK